MTYEPIRKLIPLEQFSYVFFVSVVITGFTVSDVPVPLAVFFGLFTLFSMIHWWKQGEYELEIKRVKPDFMKTEHEKVMQTDSISDTEQTSWSDEYWSNPVNHQTRVDPEDELARTLSQLRETVEERRQRRREEFEEWQEEILRGTRDNDERNYWY